MTILQSIILGIVQGITEFLPISSSAHLVILPFIFNWDHPPQDAFIFDVLVQMGTLIAVIVYFREDLFNIVSALLHSLSQRKLPPGQDSLLGWYILLSTIPAVIFGLILGDTVERAFGSPRATATFLLITATLLIIAEKTGKRELHMSSINWKDAIIIGLFQALALFPGVSRSGATIAGGMIRNIDRSSAARFSFLMSVPVMIAAGTLSVVDLVRIPNFVNQIPTLLAGLVTSAVIGYLSIRWMLSYLTNHSLYLFAGYCILISIIVWSISLIG
jgi:undecaprenyl-diphosphatase